MNQDAGLLVLGLSSSNSTTCSCRCRLIPLLNKELSRIHSEHLPQPCTWVVETNDSISKSRVAHFEKTASSVITLQVHNDKLSGTQAKTVCLVQLLNAAAVSAPKLQRLEVGAMHYCRDVRLLVVAISRLSELKELELKLWNLRHAEQLAGLRKLQASPPQSFLLLPPVQQLSSGLPYMQALAIGAVLGREVLRPDSGKCLQEQFWSSLTSRVP